MVLGSDKQQTVLDSAVLIPFYMDHPNEKCSISLLAVPLKLALCL